MQNETFFSFNVPVRVLLLLFSFVETTSHHDRVNIAHGCVARSLGQPGRKSASGAVYGMNHRESCSMRFDGAITAWQLC
ncbi:hypothetical protein IF1G_00577 [Cordyceps javanica]|uniref:Secreted protein n=1 Tax=Cordyceps javanica TaxID=43265 RepID=A0A545VFZ8_9HYPO|nr:hypothetical protein IF1G_00577 [Cordyceps javanica]